MKWANSDVERESDPNWLLIPAALRAHHHALIIACSREENSGVLKNCSDHSDLWWWALAGFRRRLIPKLVAKGLVEWVDDGKSLRVHFYDTIHELIAIASRHHARNMAKARWDAYAARRAASIAAGNARSTAASKAAGYAPDPDPDPQIRKEEEGPPPGDDPDSGPEGFERWWALYPKTRARWRGDALRRWVAQDLEGETDEILAFTRYQMASKTWKKGEYYIDSPRDFLRSGSWRKLRRAPAAAAPASEPRATEPSKAEIAYRNMMALIADVDASDAQKDRAKKGWVELHPGEIPPWLQPKQQNGRAA